MDFGLARYGVSLAVALRQPLQSMTADLVFCDDHVYPGSMRMLRDPAAVVAKNT